MKQLLVIVGLLAFARPAHADGDADDRKFAYPEPTANDDKPAPERSVLMLGGGNLGIALHPDKVGGLLGAEVSVPYVDMDRLLWGGLYIDGAYDTANSSTRFSIGPELGWGYFGVDGGFVHQFGGDGPEAGGRNGLAVRPCLSITVVTLYFRHETFFDDQPGSSLNEIGVLLKYGTEVHHRGPRKGLLGR